MNWKLGLSQRTQSYFQAFFFFFFFARASGHFAGQRGNNKPMLSFFPMTDMKSQFRSHCSSRRLKTMHWHRIPQGPLCRGRVFVSLAAPATDLARDALFEHMDKSIPMLPYHTESLLELWRMWRFRSHTHACMSEQISTALSRESSRWSA